jgi:hypothetical protein
LYQTFATGAFAKFECTVIAPAEPSVALVPLQVSGLKAACTLITTLLFSSAPHWLAAVWNTCRRCAPSVVNGLLGNAATTAGSLNPSPGPSMLTTVMVAASCGRAGEQGERGEQTCVLHRGPRSAVVAFDGRRVRRRSRGARARRDRHGRRRRNAP